MLEPDVMLDEGAQLRRSTASYLRERIRRHQIPVSRSGRRAIWSRKSKTVEAELS
jgi:hypothetical protein